MNKVLDYFWSIGGGTTGSVIGFLKAKIVFLGFITWYQALEIILMAAIGATVGWLVKFLLDSFKKYCKTKLNKKL